MPNTILLLILLVLTVAPVCNVSAYQGAEAALSGKAVVTVPANSDPWTNSGFVVERGKRYRVQAEGKWRVYPACNETGPDGAGLYNPGCWDLLLTKFVRTASHGALLVRIGERGKPFVVGADLEFEAGADGVLFFHINETVGFDNTGSVNVTVSDLSGRTPEPVATPPTAPAKAPEPSKAAVKDIPAPAAPLSADGRRQALVIGNAAYAGKPLANPVNDARDVAAALGRLGFKTSVLINADRRAMIQAIQEFGRNARDTVAVFYFAGHGVQVRGENFLIPVGANIRSEADVEHEAISAGRVLGTLDEAQNRLNIVVLDACRDNPYGRGFRSDSRGLASISAPKGTIIAYATAPGDVAQDGSGRNSPYTSAVLRNLATPGQSIEFFFKEVGRDVDRATGGRQRPWIASDFLGDFSFARQ